MTHFLLGLALGLVVGWTIAAWHTLSEIAREMRGRKEKNR